MFRSFAKDRNQVVLTDQEVKHREDDWTDLKSNKRAAPDEAYNEMPCGQMMYGTGSFGSESEADTAGMSKMDVERGYKCQPLKDTDEVSSSAQVAGFYSSVSTEGDLNGFIERQNVLDRL